MFFHHQCYHNNFWHHACHHCNDHGYDNSDKGLDHCNTDDDQHINDASDVKLI